jgi:hypothetical protein
MKAYPLGGRGTAGDGGLALYIPTKFSPFSRPFTTINSLFLFVVFLFFVFYISFRDVQTMWVLAYGQRD